MQLQKVGKRRSGLQLDYQEQQDHAYAEQKDRNYEISSQLSSSNYILFNFYATENPNDKIARFFGVFNIKEVPQIEFM